MRKAIMSVAIAVLAPSSMNIAMASTSSSSSSWWNLSPYIGVDAQVRRMDYKGGFGDNIFRHHSPQGNIYAGARLNDNIGVELGYQATRTRARTATLLAGDISLGGLIAPVLSPCVVKSKVKIQGPHLDVVGFYTLSERYPLQVMGSVGVSVLKSTFERKTISLPNPNVRKLTRTISKRKAVLRLGIGLQNMFTERFGARLTLNWVNTTRITAKSNDNVTPQAFAKPKNSTVYGIGILWKF